MEMREQGLVVGAGSVLVRMTADGAPRLALEADRARCLALLAVGCGQPVAAGLLRHIEAASDHWRRGDKALANLRLVFANLPRLEQPADAYRLALAEYLLDEGVPPLALLKSLGLDAWADEPRVPAGHHRESGRWTSGPSSPGPLSSADASNLKGGQTRIVIAVNDDLRHNFLHLQQPGPIGVDAEQPPQEILHPINPNDFFGMPRPGGLPDLFPVTPAGGRLGSASTRALNAAIGAKLEEKGYQITGGAGKRPEEHISGGGPGTRGSNYVDVTARHSETGDIVRVQTIDTKADGSPTRREAAAARRIKSVNPTHTLVLIRKK